MVWGTPQSVNSRVEWSYDDNDGKYEFVGFIGASNSQNVRNLSPIAFKVAECRYGEVEEEIEETIEEEIEEVVEEIVDELEDGDQAESTSVSEGGEEQPENADDSTEPTEGDEAQAGDNQEGEATEPNTTEGAT